MKNNVILCIVTLIVMGTLVACGETSATSFVTTEEVASDVSLESQDTDLEDEKTYNEGQKYLQEGNYVQAKQCFDKILEYKDSKEIVEMCNSTIMYVEACNLLDYGYVREGYEILKTLDNSIGKTAELKDLCEKYAPLVGTWNSTEYIVIEDDGEHNLPSAVVVSLYINPETLEVTGLWGFPDAPLVVEGDMLVSHTKTSQYETYDTFDINTHEFSGWFKNSKEENLKRGKYEFFEYDEKNVIERGEQLSRADREYFAEEERKKNKEEQQKKEETNEVQQGTGFSDYLKETDPELYITISTIYNDATRETTNIYESPYEDEKLSDYIKRVSPDLYDSMNDRYNSLK